MLINAIFYDGVENLKTDKLYQYDVGQKLKVSGLTMNEKTEIHFKCPYTQIARIATGTLSDSSLTVDIPDEFLEESGLGQAWVCLTDENEVTTIRTINIPIVSRAKPDGYVSKSDGTYKKFNDEISKLYNDVIVANNNIAGINENVKDINTTLTAKANKSDVYTKDEVESLLDEYDANYVVDRLKDKADKTALDALSKTVTDNKTATDTALATKANKADFEQGTGNLSCIDDAAKSVIKSASFNYVKNNNAVTITFNIVFNAGTIPQSGFVRFSGLPFKTLNAEQLLMLVVDNKNKQYYCKLYGTWLSFTAVSGATVSADETISFSTTYII